MFRRRRLVMFISIVRVFLISIRLRCRIIIRLLVMISSSVFILTMCISIRCVYYYVSS